MSTSKIGRDAGNGQFIPVKEAERRPATTTVERITRPSPAPSRAPSPPPRKK